MTATRGLALTTTVRVVDRVHHDTADRRALAEVALAASLGEHLVHVVRVGHGADGCQAAVHHHAKLAGGQLDLGVSTIAANQLGIGAGGADHLRAHRADQV